MENADEQARNAFVSECDQFNHTYGLFSNGQYFLTYYYINNNMLRI